MTPLELARQTLMQLSKSQTPPTPENFRRVYDEISGVKSVDQATILSKSLEKVLHDLGKAKPKYLAAAQKISTLVDKQDATNLEDQLRKLFPVDAGAVGEVNWTNVIRTLIKQLDVNHQGVTLSRKKDSLNRVMINFANNSNQLGQKIQALVTSWGDGQLAIQTAETQLIVSAEPAQAQPANVMTNADNGQQKLAVIWRDMLIRTISLVVLPQLAGIPGAALRVDALIKRAQQSQAIEDVNDLSEGLKSILLRAEMQNDSQHHMQEALLQMLRLLISSMGELTIDDKWLHGQIKIVQTIISQPLNIDSIYNAESSLKDLIFKQASIKPGLIEAKDTLKSMISTFVSNLADITATTNTYEAKISEYQKQISTTEDMAQINTILQNLVNDINTMSADAKNLTLLFKKRKNVL